MDYETTFFKSEVKNKLISMLHIMNVEKLKQSISRSFANNSWHQIGSIGSDESKLTTKWELNWVVGEVLDVQPVVPVTVVELVSPLVSPLLCPLLCPVLSPVLCPVLPQSVWLTVGTRGALRARPGLPHTALVHVHNKLELRLTGLTETFMFLHIKSFNNYTVFLPLLLQFNFINLKII